MGEYRKAWYSRPDGRRALRLETRDSQEEPWEHVAGDIHAVEEGVDGSLEHIDAYKAELESIRQELWSSDDIEEALGDLNKALSGTESSDIEASLRALIAEIARDMREQGLYREEENRILDLQHLSDIRTAMDALPDISAGFWKDLKVSGASTTEFTERAPISLSGEVMKFNDDPIQMLRGLLFSGTVPSFRVLYHELIHRTQAQYQKDLPTHVSTLITLTQEASRAFVACSALFALSATAPQTTSVGASVAAIVLTKGFLSTLRDAQQFLRDPRSSFSKQMLMEVQAHAADRELISRATRAQYIHNTLSKYILSEFVPVDHILVGFQQIEELRALGAAHQEITALVMRSRWDKEKGEYDTLQVRIEDMARQRGLSRTEVEGLVDENRLRRELRGAQICVLAQRKVERLLSTLEHTAQQKFDTF